MNEVNKLFGAVQLQKVGTCKVEALSSMQDAYVAKVNNGSTSKIAVIAMAPHSANSLNIQPLSQLDWSSLHVRSYSSKKMLEASLKDLVSKEVLSQLQIQKVTSPNWGDEPDMELTAVNVTSSNTTYKSSAALPFKVTLHSVYKDNKHGTELENDIEYIPALLTYNFTLQK